MICAKKHIIILETMHFEENNVGNYNNKNEIHGQHIAILNI